jgi:hypothetical protein
MLVSDTFGSGFHGHDDDREGRRHHHRHEEGREGRRHHHRHEEGREGREGRRH